MSCSILQEVMEADRSLFCSVLSAGTKADQCARPQMHLRSFQGSTCLLVSILSLVSWRSVSAAGFGVYSGGVVTKPNPSFPTTDAEWYDSVNCPSWLTDYIEFHAKTKGTDDARYMVFSCHQHECYFGECGTQVHFSSSELTK